MDPNAARALSGPVALRYRVSTVEHSVELSLNGRLVALARPSKSAVRQSLLGAFFTAGEESPNKTDWNLAAFDSGAPWAVARRLEAPRRMRGPRDSVHGIDSGGPIATLQPADAGGRRAIELTDGTELWYEPEHARPMYAAPAVLRDSAGRVLVRVARSDNSDVAAFVPADGLINALDLVLVPEPDTSPEVRLATLFAALLDTQSRNHVYSGDLGHGPPAGRAPVGMSRRQAHRAEVERSHDVAREQRLNDFQARARAAGNDALVQRLEERRRRKD